MSGYFCPKRFTNLEISKQQNYKRDITPYNIFCFISEIYFSAAMLLHTVLNTILFKGRLINRYFQIDVHFEPIHLLPKDVNTEKNRCRNRKFRKQDYTTLHPNPLDSCEKHPDN